MGIPRVFGVSAEAAASAEAALTFSLQVPETPYPVTSSKNEKNGDEFHRWAEVMLIDKAYVEESKNGFTTFVIEGKIRTGMPNQNRRVFGRHYMDFDAFAQGDAADKGKQVMNDRTIAALSSLFKATDYNTPDGGLPADLLTMMFPAKEQGAGSPLHGKAVTVNLCDAPNKGEGAKTKRKTNAESYNSAPGI